MSLTPSLAKGAQGAWHELALSHAPRLFHLCHFLIADPVPARSLALQALSKGLKSLREGKLSEASLSATLNRQALSLCRDHWKKSSPEALRPDKSPLPETLTDPAAQLSPYRRFVLAPSRLCGYSSKQTGELLHLPASTVEAEQKLLGLLDGKTLQKDAQHYCLSSEEEASVLSLADELRLPLWKQETRRKKKLALTSCALILALCLCVGLVWGLGSIISTSQGGTQLSGPQNVPANVYQEVTVDVNKTYYADIVIRDYGTITVKLDPKNAPITVSRFTQLAKEGFYDGLTFHRIMKGFMMQGGDPSANGTGGSGVDILGEFKANGVNNTLLHERGVISMARGGYSMNSADSQFFIMHKKAEHLDGNYAAFGIVTQGIEIVDQICEAAQPTDNNGSILKSRQPVIETITIREE